MNQGPDEKYEALGESEEFLSLQERISRAARTDRPVIFIGERGTGKEMAAIRLHLLSERWGQSYVTLNCASLVPTLIESELFGHEAGAFTGAVRLRKGRFEMASGGSLFLDEIANIPMPVQEKILRVVEYGEMERVGSSSSLTVDVRLIAATNVDLRRLARRGGFRQDLLDRLSFEVITLPPLRARAEDIALLADYFARRMAAELGLGEQPRFTPRARRTLLDHHWPGNIRELKNVVERMVYRFAGEEIDEIVFDPFDSPHTPVGTLPLGSTAAAPPQEEAIRHRIDPAPDAGHSEPAAPAISRAVENDLDGMDLAEAVRALELRRIRKALEDHQFNQRKAADSLGLSYHQFRGYYRKYREDLVS